MPTCLPKRLLWFFVFPAILLGTITIARAQRYTDSLAATLDVAKADTDKVKTLLALSRAYAASDTTKEFYYANDAASLSDVTQWDKGKMFSEELIGDCYNKIKGYNDAIVHLRRSIAEAEKLHRVDVEALCLQLMAHSYRGMSDRAQMIICQQAAVVLAEKAGDPENYSSQVRAYGLYLSEAGRYRDAITVLQGDAAYIGSHFSGTQQMDKDADIMNIMAGAYLKINEADSALYYLRIASKLAAQTNNQDLTAYLLSTFCDVYESVKAYDSAIIYGTKAIKMGEALGNIDLQQYYCKMLSNIYEQRRDPERALFYYKRYDSLINIVNNTQKNVDQAIQLTKIKIEQQTVQNEHDKKAFSIIRHNQRTALIAAAIALITLLLLILIIYRNLRQKQKANETISMQAESLQQQNEIIDKSLKEKEILLKETHHRIKNNLQLISSLLELQAANQDDENIKNALHTAQQRVWSIATVHNKLYGNNENSDIEFSTFTADLFSRLDIAFGNEPGMIRFENAIPATLLPLSTVVLLGLILNELITNSFKHAFSGGKTGFVRISLEFTGSLYTLHYADNGPGMPKEKFHADTGSLGLYLIRRMSKQLKGMASYKFDMLSIFTIIFPDGKG